MNATVVAEQGGWQCTGASEIVRENCHAMADVRFDIEKITGGTSPFAGVEGHYLHQSASTDRASGGWIQHWIFRQQDAHEQRGADVAAMSFFYKRCRDAIHATAVAGVFAEHSSDTLFFTARCKTTVGEQSAFRFSIVQYEIQNLGKRWTLRDDDRGRQRYGRSDRRCFNGDAPICRGFCFNTDARDPAKHDNKRGRAQG